MNSTLKALLDIVEQEPLPEQDTSSHWRVFGERTRVKFQNGKLALHGDGFGVTRLNTLNRFAYFWGERFYQPYTAQVKSFDHTLRLAKKLAKDVSFDLSFDMWKQVVALSLLRDHWEAYRLSPQTFALIGDGYAFLGALIRRVLPQARLYCVDLPKILVFQVQTFLNADPSAEMSLYPQDDKVCNINFVLPQHIEGISETIDCAINITSMGEMKKTSIAAYFDFLRKRSSETSRFYCLNRVAKEHPNGDVIAFDHYPWHKDDEVFFDELCPYHTHYWHSRVLTPALPFLRLPALIEFDGPLKHRLLRLASVI